MLLSSTSNNNPCTNNIQREHDDVRWLSEGYTYHDMGLIPLAIGDTYSIVFGFRRYPDHGNAKRNRSTVHRLTGLVEVEQRTKEQGCGSRGGMERILVGPKKWRICRKVFRYSWCTICAEPLRLMLCW